MIHKTTKMVVIPIEELKSEAEDIAFAQRNNKGKGIDICIVDTKSKLSRYYTLSYEFAILLTEDVDLKKCLII